jgi:hypothetical protein
VVGQVNPIDQGPYKQAESFMVEPRWGVDTGEANVHFLDLGKADIHVDFNLGRHCNFARLIMSGK